MRLPPAGPPPPPPPRQKLSELWAAQKIWQDWQAGWQSILYLSTCLAGRKLFATHLDLWAGSMLGMDPREFSMRGWMLNSCGSLYWWHSLMSPPILMGALHCSRTSKRVLRRNYEAFTVWHCQFEHLHICLSKMCKVTTQNRLKASEGSLIKPWCHRITSHQKWRGAKTSILLGSMISYKMELHIALWTKLNTSKKERQPSKGGGGLLFVISTADISTFLMDINYAKILAILHQLYLQGFPHIYSELGTSGVF